jgi:hypothetical protein
MSFLGFHRHGGSGEGGSQPPEAHPGWEAALSGETEAFLEGRIVEQLTAAARMVPTWAVLNKLAHGSPIEIADLTQTDGQPDDAPDAGEPVWRAAQRSLAARVLARGTAPDDITHVQQTLLVPLELRLIEQSKVETVTLRQALTAASDALNLGGFSS